MISTQVTVVAPGYIRTGHSLHALTGDGRAYDKNDAATASGADPAAVARVLMDAADRRQPERLVAPGAGGRPVVLGADPSRASALLAGAEGETARRLLALIESRGVAKDNVLTSDFY